MAVKSSSPTPTIIIDRGKPEAFTMASVVAAISL